MKLPCIVLLTWPRHLSADAMDFSSVKVKLYSASGFLKHETECAPNGYFFVPLYDKVGSFQPLLCVLSLLLGHLHAAGGGPSGLDSVPNETICKW